MRTRLSLVFISWSVAFLASLPAFALAAAQASPAAAEADALFERAIAAIQAGDVPQALPLLEQAAVIDISLGDARKPDLANDWTTLGACLSALGRTDEAVARLESAIGLWRELEAWPQAIVTLEQLGIREYSHGRLASAQGRFEEGLRLAEAHALPKAVPGLFSNLGMVLQAMGRDAQALEHYQKVLAHEAASALDRAKALGNIANLHLVAGRLSEAEAAYTQASAGFEEAGDAASITSTTLNLGLVYLTGGKYDEARAAIEKALERARLERLSEVEAAAQLHLGEVLAASGQYDLAEKAYEESLRLFRAADSPQNAAAALSGLGMLQIAWNRPDRALVLGKEALDLAQKHELQDQVMGSLELLGSAERNGGHINTAILHYERALEIATRLGRDGDRLRVLNELGTAFFCWNKRQEAEKHFQESLALAERLGHGHTVVRSFIHLGAVRQVAGELATARESYLRALELARAAGTTPEQAIALNNLGTVALATGDHDGAERYLLDSIALDERFRLTAKDEDRPASFVPYLSSYRWLVLLQFLRGDASGVFDASERIKARHLSEEIGSRSGRQPEPAGIEAFRRDLPPRTAIVSFANVDWQYPLAVVATKTGTLTYALEVEAPKPKGQAETRLDAAMFTGVMPRASALGTLTSEYRELLALRAPSVLERARREALARRLFKILLGPAEGALAGTDALVVIPDGSLSLIPFETLRLPDGRYLVERQHVTYAPSLRVLTLLRSRRSVSHSRSLLAIGGAPKSAGGEVRVAAAREVSEQQWAALRAAAQRRLESGKGAGFVYEALGRGRWADLPGARAEVEAIGRLVPRSLVLSGADVSEAKLKALSQAGSLREFEILHFATHGIVIPEAPELSALVLAEAGGDGQKEDGYLSAQEIAALDLAPEFVNLSACETGVGRIYGGEGTVGLTQAFLSAGAKGVSVSLWPLQDTFTRDFMVGLYRRVRGEGVSHARAMTEMKRAFIRQGGVEPFLWAPFVYYGKE